MSVNQFTNQTILDTDKFHVQTISSKVPGEVCEYIIREKARRTSQGLQRRSIRVTVDQFVKIANVIGNHNIEIGAYLNERDSSTTDGQIDIEDVTNDQLP